MPSWRSRSARSPASRQVTIGGQQKPAIRIQIDPAKLVAKGLSLEDVRSQIAITTVDSPKGNIDGATRSLHHLRQRPAADAEGLERRHRRLSQRRPAARSATSARPSTGPEDAKQAAWANGKRGVFLVVFKQPGANVIDTVDKIKATLPRLRRGHPAGDQDRGPQRPHADHPRRGARTSQFTLLLTIAPGRDGDLHLPAQLLGHRHPERHRAAGAARRLRADVGVRLYASTICR